MKWLLCLLVIFAIGALRARDIVHLQSGETVAGTIDAITDSIINITLPVAGVAGGTARRTLPTAQVDHIEFGFAEGEQAAFAARGQAPVAILKSWWEYSLPQLHRPRSRTAAWGVAFADAILREEGSSGGERALAIYDRVIARAWSEEDVSLARQGRLRSLMANQQLELAIAEAKQFADETDDPALLIEVEHLLAVADFEKLRSLEAEHPRWVDDEVRPLREELYHRTLDRFLRPHLFHATLEKAAARGLFAAADLFLFAGEEEEARARWSDLVALYPSAPEAVEAAARLEAKPTSP